MGERRCARRGLRIPLPDGWDLIPGAPRPPGTLESGGRKWLHREPYCYAWRQPCFARARVSPLLRLTQLLSSVAGIGVFFFRLDFISPPPRDRAFAAEAPGGISSRPRGGNGGAPRFPRGKAGCFPCSSSLSPTISPARFRFEPCTAHEAPAV